MSNYRIVRRVHSYSEWYCNSTVLAEDEDSRLFHSRARLPKMGTAGAVIESFCGYDGSRRGLTNARVNPSTARLADQLTA